MLFHLNPLLNNNNESPTKAGRSGTDGTNDTPHFAGAGEAPPLVGRPTYVL